MVLSTRFEPGQRSRRRRPGILRPTWTANPNTMGKHTSHTRPSLQGQPTTLEVSKRPKLVSPVGGASHKQNNDHNWRQPSTGKHDQAEAKNSMIERLCGRPRATLFLCLASTITTSTRTASQEYDSPQCLGSIWRTTTGNLLLLLLQP